MRDGGCVPVGIHRTPCAPPAIQNALHCAARRCERRRVLRADSMDSIDSGWGRRRSRGKKKRRGGSPVPRAPVGVIFCSSARSPCARVISLSPADEARSLAAARRAAGDARERRGGGGKRAVFSGLVCGGVRPRWQGCEAKATRRRSGRETQRLRPNAGLRAALASAAVGVRLTEALLPHALVGVGSLPLFFSVENLVGMSSAASSLLCGHARAAPRETGCGRAPPARPCSL